MEPTLIPKIIALPVALVFSLLFTISIIDLASKLKLYDANNHLKRHLERVCSLGGISIFTAFWIGTFLLQGFGSGDMVCFLFIGSLFLFLTGVKDDLVGISPLKRLLIQIGVASLLFWGGVRLTYVPGFDIALPFAASYFLTILLIGTIVNAYNFIDGINGLAGGLSVISSLAFALVFYVTGQESYAIMAMALGGAIAGFLYFNFGKAKIFMGDNGSTFIGIMFSFFTIIFLQHHAANGSSTGLHPAGIMAIVIIPVFDMVKVVVGRLVRGKSPFRGDRTHIHHVFLNAGLKHEIVCYALYAWNILLIAGSILLFPQNFFLAALMLLMVAGVPYLALNNFQKIGKEKEQPDLKVTNTGDLL